MRLLKAKGGKEVAQSIELTSDGTCQESQQLCFTVTVNKEAHTFKTESDAELKQWFPAFSFWLALTCAGYRQ
jgi:hypothetical protein